MTSMRRSARAWVGDIRRGFIASAAASSGLRQLAPIDHIRRLAPVPVLLVTGSEDPHAPPRDAERLYAHCHEPRELAIIPGAEHGNVCAKGGLVYERCILSFLERRLAA